MTIQNYHEPRISIITPYRFSEEEIGGIIELGEILRKIHERLVIEGYTINDGTITKPI
jgi:hypothetical protein